MKKIFLIAIVMALILAISTVSAVDSSSWKVVKISGNDFRIPPEYSTGQLDEDSDSYEIDNWNTFAILCVDTYLANNYGYVIDNADVTEKMNINGHPAIFICGYNSYEKANLCRIYFSSANSIYCLSWKGDNYTDNLLEIVASSPASNVNDSSFYEVLDTAQNQHELEEQEDASTAYVPSYSRSSSNNYYFYPFFYY